jgi:TolB protein
LHTFLPPSLQGRVSRVKRIVLLLASLTAGLALAGVLALGVPNEQARAAFPGTNGKIAFVSRRVGGTNEIYTISTTGHNLRRLTHNTKSDKTPSWSPVGKKIVFERDDSLYIMNADGSNQRKIPNTTHSNFEIGRYGSYGGNPAFSPGGRKIIFDKDKNIYTINADGSNSTRITNAHAGGRSKDDPTFVHPVWSPVSNKIAFSWLYKGAREIHVLALSDLTNKQFLGPESRVTPAGIGVYRPDWSPDGTQIIYECSDDPCDESGGTPSDNPEIYKVNADGTGNTRLTIDTADDSYPVFSPTGGKIVFSSNRPSPKDGSTDYELYIMDADGHNVRQLTNNSALDILPDWQPVH